MCDKNCGATFQTTKAYYLAQTYAASLAEGLEVTAWYSLLDTWRAERPGSDEWRPIPGVLRFHVCPKQAGDRPKNHRPQRGEHPGVRDHHHRWHFLGGVVQGWQRPDSAATGDAAGRLGRVWQSPGRDEVDAGDAGAGLYRDAVRSN